MADDKHPAPLQFKGVMVSSTFTDLKAHRVAIIKAIDAQGRKAVVMENDSAKPGIDVIDSSIQMVRDSSAYVAIISHKYGQVPECSERNPDHLSLTELEFKEAQRIGRPVLLFIMGDNHDVKPGNVERDAEKFKKLEAFKETAKRMRADSSVHRVYKVFNDFHEFELAATRSVAELRRYLDEQPEASELPSQGASPSPEKRDTIPTPLVFYAEPAYIGSHDFVGRKSQLETLSDWASAADPHPVLLFEAIGGAGKSMLTWEWTTNHSANIRGDWAGRFWYSFYEKGAVMADFCRRALAYITGQPIETFYRKKTAELGEQLLRHLRTRPWLFILDGLERVLVAYHRFDAAQLADEKAGTTDEIAHRDPCSAIRPEDDDLLRALAAAAPSKILITSRLVPRTLLNLANQPIPGILRERLPGLRPADAEALLRSCGITGTSQEIQDYLQRHCDCHPLVTGVLAGLINDYLPDRGNFDVWVGDPAGGGQLNLANLDLTQKRNHILYTALSALSKESLQLLSTLALLSESVDYATLSAFNPHLPAKPEEMEKPEKPEDDRKWKWLYDEEKKQAQQNYQSAIQRQKEYEAALIAWQRSPEFLAAPQELTKTVRDLERRGLLQYDAQAKHYDLHPVVRGIAAGGLQKEEKEQYGQRVVDHFSQQTHSPYEEAETLDDLRNGIQIVRTLLQMGRYQQAYEAYRSDLSQALKFNLETYAESLSLLRPFFPQGWASLPEGVDERAAIILLNEAAYLLAETGELKESLVTLNVALLTQLQQENWLSMYRLLIHAAYRLSTQNRLVRAGNHLRFALDIATLIDNEESLFLTRLHLFNHLVVLGKWKDAEAMWQLLDSMGRNSSRSTYRSGNAEYVYARFRFWQGGLKEEQLAQAEQLIRASRSRPIIRRLHYLRGEWQLEQGQWALAADSFHEAVRMAREIGQSDTAAETLLAIARFYLDQLSDPRHEAEQLAGAKESFHRGLAELWLLIGDTRQAKKHALAAYDWAWADGEPYVRRYELNKARALLDQLGAEVPNLPSYDPAKDEKLPWEDELVSAIEKLRVEVNARNQAKKNVDAGEEE
ncbi:MAG TPA: DUF4062 domain-containing protein [Blastocatellia bacterium]|nr:DUF4062 domain-containing protein [Blastocatellia bacterium]